MRAIWLLHFLFTFALVGVIWFVQLVHYPLFLQLTPDRFVEAMKQHQTWTGRLVGPLMLAELGSGIWLTLFSANGRHPYFLSSLALLIAIWSSTFLIQVPVHGALLHGYAKDLIIALIRWNWIRTILWTMRALLVCLAAPG